MTYPRATTPLRTQPPRSPSIAPPARFRAGIPTAPAASPGARPLACEGFFQSVAQGLGETYLSALMVWLGAGGLVLGVVGAIPTAATAFSQILALRPLGRGRGARAFIAGSWLLQGTTLVALGLLSLLAPPAAIPLTCAAAALAWFLGGLSVPTWTRLVAGTVSRERLNRFFGLRGAAQQLGVVLAILAGGTILSLTGTVDGSARGFVLLFGLAGLFRMLGAALLAGVPGRVRAQEDRPVRPLRSALRTSAKFRRLALYLWAFHFSTWVAAPFFLPYMVRELGLDYFTVGSLVAVPAIVKTLTMRWWSGVADRIGPGPLLRRSGWLVLPVSALWLVSGSVWWIVVIQAYAGFIWGAFELAQASALLQTTRGREQAVAFFNAGDGAAMILGSIVGGAVVLGADRLGGAGFLTAFAVSTALRSLSAALLLGRVRSIGIPGFSHRRIPLRLWGVRAARGATFRPWVELPVPIDDRRADPGSGGSTQGGER